MTADLLHVLGGLGLFLLGMVVMTDGLRALAGERLRRMLARFTRSPATGVLAGAGATAVLQSSSATTVATVGFVGAGLLTFPQALGIILGANIGTTVTGWLVVLLGFKLKLGTAVLPVVFLGVLLRLFARGRARDLGWALAGFALLFVGIESLKGGMAGFDVTPASLPSDSVGGRLLLVGLGILMTVITQSSSAGVATALAALDAGAIRFTQAASLVIGMAIGTTFTALLATLGGSVAVRRTGLAHVFYACLTGIGAFVLLTPYTRLVAGRIDASVALVCFHTCFNTLGVLAALPFTHAFARLMERVVPERGPVLTRHLDDRLLSHPAVAAAAGIATARDIRDEVFGLLVDALARQRVDDDRLDRVRRALDELRLFEERVQTGASEPEAHRDHLHTVHSLDHLQRLWHRCGQKSRIVTMRTEPRLARLAAILSGALRRPDTRRLDRMRRMLRRQRHSHRDRMLETATRGRIDTDVALARLDSLRWLHRVAYHAWRIAVHLG